MGRITNSQLESVVDRINAGIGYCETVEARIAELRELARKLDRRAKV